jgi:hypothetical protein
MAESAAPRPKAGPRNPTLTAGIQHGGHLQVVTQPLPENLHLFSLTLILHPRLQSQPQESRNAVLHQEFIALVYVLELHPSRDGSVP